MKKIDWPRACRRARGKLTQEQFAEKTGVKLRTIRSWEQGQNVPCRIVRDAITGKNLKSHEENISN